MSRLILILVCLLFATSSLAANTYTSKGLKDVYFGEALYHAFQGDWFQSIARLDTELGQYRGLDEPALDTLYYHVDHAEFAVGDFELAYRMHNRAGRAITAVIEGNVEEPVRNEAIYRLARLYFQKNQPENALHALERIRGVIPANIRDDLEFLRGQIFMANGRFVEAGRIFKDLQSAKSLEGFASYNLGIALLKEGKEQEGRQYLDRTGQILSEIPATLAIKDKSNLVLGYKLLDEKSVENARLVLERVRLSGPFSNRALLGSGWADASQNRFDRALVPWSILAQREVTDPAVQEAMLAVPYAYGKLNVYGHAAVMYGKALEAFGKEIDKLGSSIKSVSEGKFLEALTREELKQDANWVVKLRNLPEAPETYYLLELMASHDFQESLKNYLDLDELQKKLATWERDLDAFEDIILKRRAYYQPLLPEIDRGFRQLDSQMRLRLEQRNRIEKRLHAMLVAPRPDYLATAEERIILEDIGRLEQSLAAKGAAVPDENKGRISRLRGVLLWNIRTEYDQRLTDAYRDLRDLNVVVDQLKKQYDAFVRTRQAATQSYEGYDDVIRRQRNLIASAQEKVKVLMARQGNMLETMAVNELTKRRERLEQFQITARFAIADSYDRASKAQTEKSATTQTEKSVGNQSEKGVRNQAAPSVEKQAEKSVDNKTEKSVGK
ncbi:MAG: tetratricopeptide repeat protein [Desulfuromonadaceae bacterium]|nr:tetratricopeptide repeat protein [Desulfuromonadaceae bacterium]